MKKILMSLMMLSLAAAWAQEFSDETNSPPETNVEQMEAQERQEPGAVNHNDSQWEGQESDEFREEDLQIQQQDIDPEFDPTDDELNPDENTY